MHSLIRHLVVSQCPGSAMSATLAGIRFHTDRWLTFLSFCRFLISSLSPAPACAVIVTGDIRAEPHWVDSLRRYPSLAPYIPDPPGTSATGLWKSTLDCIYLDTSCVMRNEELVTKVSRAPHALRDVKLAGTPTDEMLCLLVQKEAIDHFIDTASLYPPDTRFFLNCWTWGYEDLLLAVHRTFKTKIHLDSYKLRQYSTPGMFKLNRTLATLGTKGELSRFHACERRLKCAQCYGDGRGCYDVPQEQLKRHLKGRRNEGRVVYVNPVEIGRKRWEDYKRVNEAALSGGPDTLPNHIVRRRPRSVCAARDGLTDSHPPLCHRWYPSHATRPCPSYSPSSPSSGLSRSTRS